MAFLNKSMLAKMAVEATATKHPMLDKLEVPLNVKEAYLQGCVLAAVLKDESLSDSKRTEVSRLGASLQLSDSEIGECISIVTGLTTDDAKEQFVGEMFSVLSGGVYPKYFMKDFEELLRINGEVPSEMTDYLDYFGSTLCNDKNWRSVLKETDKSEEPASDSSVVQADASSAESVQTAAVDAERSLDGTGSYFIMPDRCVGCGACAGACPAEAITDYPYAIDRGKCVDCGACEGACPADAIARREVDSARDLSAIDYAKDPMFMRARDIIVEQLGVNAEQVTLDAHFIDDLGADSLDAVELIMAFEEEFGAAIPEEDAARLATVGKVVDYLHSKGY